jgi:hypothetical protein
MKCDSCKWRHDCGVKERGEVCIDMHEKELTDDCKTCIGKYDLASRIRCLACVHDYEILPKNVRGNNYKKMPEVEQLEKLREALHENCHSWNDIDGCRKEYFEDKICRFLKLCEGDK